MQEYIKSTTPNSDNRVANFTGSKNGSFLPNFNSAEAAMNKRLKVVADSERIENPLSIMQAKLTAPSLTKKITTPLVSEKPLSKLAQLRDDPPTKTIDGISDLTIEKTKTEDKNNRTKAATSAAEKIRICFDQKYNDGNHREAIWQVYRTLAEYYYISKKKPLQLYALMDALYRKGGQIPEEKDGMISIFNDYISTGLQYTKSWKKRREYLEATLASIENIREQFPRDSSGGDSHVDRFRARRLMREKLKAGTIDPKEFYTWHIEQNKIDTFRRLHSGSISDLSVTNPPVGVFDPSTKPWKKH